MQCAAKEEWLLERWDIHSPKLSIFLPFEWFCSTDHFVMYRIVFAAAQTNRIDMKANRLQCSAGLKGTSKPLHRATVEKQKLSTSSCLKVKPEVKNPLSDYGPHVSTPHSHRCVELKTPAFSCIQPHRTVSFLTPALKQSTSKPVQKHTPAITDAMSLRYVMLMLNGRICRRFIWISILHNFCCWTY